MKILTSILLLLSVLTPPVFAQDYIVGEGDVLKVTVYQNDDLSTKVRVSGDGRIAVPLLGQVEVINLPLSKVAEKLAALYKEGYLVNPQVTVFVEEFRSQKAVILGEVNKAGLYELSGTTTLLELISKAGGLNKEAGTTAIIKRKSDKAGAASDQVITIDLGILVEQGDLSKNLAILDGDNVYIAKAGLVYVTGEVEKPDAYKCDSNTTVIKAITLAGGFTGKAAKDSVRIIRKEGGSERQIDSVRMDDPVHPDDVLVIPESFF